MRGKKHRILLRADGNSTIGLGHVMRLLGLSELLKNDFSCFFLIRQPDFTLKQTIESYCNVIVLNSTTLNSELSELDFHICSDDVLVLDGYNFDENYQLHIKSKIYKLIMLDDKADLHFYADLVINHGSNISKDIYKKESYTKILNGTKYLILRKEFLNAAALNRNISKIESAFICFGGSDTFNITTKVLKATINCDFIKKVIVIMGNAFTLNYELENMIIEGSNIKEIIIKKNVNACQLVELIRQCELAICPASTIALEICCVKSGLLTGLVADNQSFILNNLISSECCLSIGDFNKSSTDDISLYLIKLNNINIVNKLMTNQSKMIDGLSGNRILKEFKLLYK